MSDKPKLIDGWRAGTNDGAPCMYAPNLDGFVAFNEDMSALYVADVREVPFLVIDELRKQTERRERWAQRVLDESAGNHAKKTGKLGTYEMTVATASDGSLTWAVDVPGYELFGEETPDRARIWAARALCADSPELPKEPL